MTLNNKTLKRNKNSKRNILELEKKNLEINPKIYRYTNDGQGRDTYITYSVIKNSNYFPPVPSSPKQHVNKSHDLSLRKPIKK